MKPRFLLASFLAMSAALLPTMGAGAAEPEIVFHPFPIPIPHPIHFNFLRPLDATHAVVTTLNNWTPQSTTPATVCYQFVYEQDCTVPNTLAPLFTADLGAGVEVDSVGDVRTTSATSSAIAEVDFISGPVGTRFLHLTGFLDTPNASLVTASVQGQFFGGTEGGPPGYLVTPVNSTLPQNAMLLAIQTQDAAGNWDDVSVTALAAMPLHAGEWSTVSLAASASVPTGTAVRAELRSGAEYLEDTAFFKVISGVLTVPECIPDMSNPGACL